jgi:hypothetical protein
MVEFVASGDTRSQLHSELDYQNESGYTDETAAVAIGGEAAAGLILTGDMRQIVDQEGGEKVVFYQVNFKLTQIKDGKTLWMGGHKIKKYMSQSSASF